jgi:hypothetical protein
MSRNHSSIVGGSTAERLLNCPGSWQATMALPPAADKSSEYAEEGSFAHKVMDRIMFLRKATPDAQRNFNAFVVARGLLGDKFHDREVTQRHLDELIEPALVHLHVLEDAYGGRFDVLAIEHRVVFPGIVGAFGTIDLILGSPTTVLHIDWKFGQGVGVKAVYDRADGQVVNAQLMYYLAAAMNSSRHLYKGDKKLALAIIQPRGAEPLTFTDVTRKEVKWFREDMQGAVDAAIQRDPLRQKGEWCRFAPCKINCPLWVGPMLDLGALQLVPRTEVVAKEVTPYAEYLARAKVLVDMLEQFGREVNDQLHAYLEDGGTVPGWRLKKKVKQRQWIDDMIEVADTLADLGFTEREIWQDKLQTFAVVDTAARRHGVKIPEHLRVAPETNETTVCRTDDPAPPVERHTALEQFVASVELLRKPA